LVEKELKYGPNKRICSLFIDSPIGCTLVATALARLTGMLVADQTASLRRYDPDQVLRVASLCNEALSKLTPLAVVQM